MAETKLNRWVLITALGLLVVIPSILTVWLRDAALVWPVTLSCIAAVLLIRLPDVVLFKAGPLEARMRDATEKAEATIEQLQQLAGALTNPVLGAVMASGRIGGYRRKDSLAMRDKIVSELTAIGLNEKQLSAATEQYDHYLGIDLLLDLRNLVRSEEHEASSDEAKACFENKEGKFDFNNTAESLRLCLDKAGVLTKEVAAALDDLEQFQRDGTLRRREVFISRRG